MTDRVEFNHDDSATVEEIVERWMDLCAAKGREIDLLSVQMDIMAANGVNGNPPLDLSKLLTFDDFNFIHDVGGIEGCIDRATGKLMNHFRPRCTAVEEFVI